MIDINKINQAQLYETRFQKDLFKEAEKIILHLQSKEAKILAKNLENSLTDFKGDPELKQDYQDLIIRLNFSALPRLVYKDIISLFKGSLRQALIDPNIPILEHLKLSLIAINPWARDDMKQELLIALRDNKHVLFKEQEKEKINVADCLKKYDQTLGTQPVEGIRLTEYLLQQFSKFKSEDQTAAKKLFDIYEYLKLTSKSRNAFKDDFTFITDEGVIQEIQDNRLINVRLPERKKLTDEELEEIRRNVLPNIKDPKEKKAFLDAAGLSDDLEEEKILVEKQIEEKLAPKPEPLINLDTAVANVMDKTKGDFPLGDLKKRFQNIVSSFFRDIRTQIETKIVLKREQKIGGMGLDQETTDKVIKILTKEKSRIDKESIKEVPLEKLEQIKDLKFKSLKEKTDKIVQAETKIRPTVLEDKKEKEKKISKLSVEIKKPKVISPPPPKPEPKPVPKPVPPPPPPKPKSIFRPIIRPQSVQSAKSRVEEIKVKPRIYGPVEELKTLSLVDWRRWGSPKEAVQKIEDKINLLAEESLVKKSEGIKAWKDSEINNLYLDIGAESIDQGKPVTEIILQRQKKGFPTLTEEEFNSVVELNQKLRF